MFGGGDRADRADPAGDASQDQSPDERVGRRARRHPIKERNRQDRAQRAERDQNGFRPSRSDKIPAKGVTTMTAIAAAVESLSDSFSLSFPTETRNAGT